MKTRQALQPAFWYEHFSLEMKENFSLEMNENFSLQMNAFDT